MPFSFVNPLATRWQPNKVRYWLLALLIGWTSTQAQTNNLPDLGDSSEAVFSEPQERAIGKRIMFEIHGDPSFVDDPELVAYINSIGNRLVTASAGAINDNRRDFEFFLLSDESINAFALPGGYIGVHSGLMLTTTTESELAGVLGHEIAHVLQRHQARGADEARKNAPLSVLGLAAALLASRAGSSSATEAALVTSQAIAFQNQLNYSRDFEREADRLGLTIMQRAGFDPIGMPGFFERMQRANRYNDGKTPGYLRTHPLNTERIAELQDRVQQVLATTNRPVVSEGSDYRFAVAKLRVMALGAANAIGYFRNAIAERTILRNRADVYGLALALYKSRDFAAADKELNGLRQSGAKHAWIENLAAQMQAAQRKWDKALALYKEAIRAFPNHRGLIYGQIETLYEAGQIDAAITHALEEIKTTPDDAMLYELLAKCYERKNKRLAQHRAIGEAYFRQGNSKGAIEQLELAIKAKDGDFYEISSAEARLREMKTLYRNRVLLPGEKPDKPEKDDPPTRPL